MNVSQLTAVSMKHEARISRMEQKLTDLQKAYSKHTNRHFQLTCIAVTQLLVLIGGLIAMLVKLS